MSQTNVKRGMTPHDIGATPVIIPVADSPILADLCDLQFDNSFVRELPGSAVAAAAAALMTTDELPQSFKILGIGLGAGKRQYERPSILRALLIEDNAQKKTP